MCADLKKKTTWATNSCKTLRLDKVKEHECSSEHISAVTIEIEKANSENVMKT